MKLLKSNPNLFPSIFSDFFEMDKFFDNFPTWDKDTWLPATNIKEDGSMRPFCILITR